MSTWIDDYYADVDAMRLEAFVERHSDDAAVVFGNNPPAVGKEAIGANIGGFWSMIGGLRHERRNLWFVNDGATAVLEVVTHYTTKGGADGAGAMRVPARPERRRQGHLPTRLHRPGPPVRPDRRRGGRPARDGDRVNGRHDGRVAVVTEAANGIDQEMRLRIADALGTGFKGDLIGPDHADYGDRSVVWNAMVDRRPGLILRCTSTEDVAAAVTVARANGLPPSVRCGGHGVWGAALSDGGLTIDLSGMRTVTVDTENQLVHADGGCLLGDLDQATAPHGLIVPAGIMSETGVGGLSLGGGIGWFSRKHGLTCDQFVSLQVVLASGEVIEVSATRHPELFWALRGGGGNFGVVTRFTLRAHRFGPMMRIGVALHLPEDAAQALREYAAIVPTLPRTVGWHAALKDAMPALPFVPPELVGRRVLMLVAMWLDDAEDPAGAELIERLNAVGRPATTAMTVMPFAARRAEAAGRGVRRRPPLLHQGGARLGAGRRGDRHPRRLLEGHADARRGRDHRSRRSDHRRR